MLSNLYAVSNEVSSRRMDESSSCPRKAYKGVECGWNHFQKPALAIFIGGLLFATGTALSLLYFTQVGNVPYLVGPVFLSVGLMFLVTGLVWVPVIKQKMVHAAMTQMNHDRPLLPEQEMNTQSCVTVS